MGETSFNAAVATLDRPIRLWVLWLTVAMVATPAALLVWRETRREGVVVGASSVLVISSMLGLHALVGFVRLLGLPHLVIWGPLAVWLWPRLRRPGIPAVPRAVLAVFLVSIAVSLVFDAVDVARWLAGERAPMTQPG